MRNVILLGCVLFAAACDVVAPEDATTVRIVSVTQQATANAPVQLRLQNIGPAGRYHAMGYERSYNTSYTGSSSEASGSELCSRVPMSIDANTTIDTEIPGCNRSSLEWVVIETSTDGGTRWTRTACYEVRVSSCPASLEKER
jgi:hypothetical protein